MKSWKIKERHLKFAISMSIIFSKLLFYVTRDIVFWLLFVVASILEGSFKVLLVTGKYFLLFLLWFMLAFASGVEES